MTVKRIIVIPISLIVLLGAFTFAYSQKEKEDGSHSMAKLWPTNQEARQSSASSTDISAAWQANYSRISFNPEMGYLSFPSKDAFYAVINSLQDEINNFKFDKGRTPLLLDLIRRPVDHGNVAQALIEHSPLSEDILIAFIKKGFPAEIVKRVLDENIQFSEKVEAAYLSASLPREIRYQLDQKRLKNIAYNNPVLQAFEQRYIRFQSLRKKKIAQETAFLATGADPESRANPANEATSVDDVFATLLNQYSEVKIGSDVYVVQPAKNIKVANGNQRILNHIRAHGDIPRNRVPVNEPANGLPLASSPPPIVPDIEVEPSGLYNLDCGGISVGSGGDATGRIKFNVMNVKDAGLQYYWDFGDGYVSYKRNPVHKYTDGLPKHKVTVTVYTALGAKCKPGGSGSGVTTPSGACYCDIVVKGTDGLTAEFAATAVSGIPAFLYVWDFGDGSTANTGTSPTVNHSYTSSGTYAVSLKITDSTGCSTTSLTTVTVHKDPPPPAPECDKRDKDKGSWTSSDETHKFNHKFKLKHFLGNCKLTASVGPHHKSLGIWWPSSTTCTVSMYGYIYTPKDSKPCGESHAVNLYKTNKTSYLLDTYHFGKSNVSVLPQSIYSTGTAYGGTSTLSLN